MPACGVCVCVCVIERGPEFVVEPRDTVVAQNSDVLFQCKVSGTPQPLVVWKKVDGQIPAERFCFSPYFRRLYQYFLSKDDTFVF